MNDQILTACKKIATQAHGLAKRSTLKQSPDFPEPLNVLLSFKIFGEDLYTIPKTLIVEDALKDDPSIPIYFLGDPEMASLFEEEYRPAVPPQYYPIAFLYAGEQIIVINRDDHQVSSFHITDVLNRSRLELRLRKSCCSFSQFLQNVQAQTVACFINPDNAGQYDMFEIFDDSTVFYSFDYEGKNGETGNTVTTSPDLAWQRYLELIQQSIDKGYTLLYGPKRLQADLLA